jgi:hypothetical protein
LKESDSIAAVAKVVHEEDEENHEENIEIIDENNSNEE